METLRQGQVQLFEHYGEVNASIESLLEFFDGFASQDLNWEDAGPFRAEEPRQKKAKAQLIDLTDD